MKTFTWRAALAMILGVATTVAITWALCFTTEPRTWMVSRLWVPKLPIDERKPRFSEQYTHYRRYQDETPKWAPWAALVTQDPDAVEVRTIVTGWPMLAMASEKWFIERDSSVVLKHGIKVGTTNGSDIVLALRPVWPGFAVNAGSFATLWLVVLCLPMSRPRWWREGWRLRRGRCPACGYDLGWNFAEGCSECAWRKGG